MAFAAQTKRMELLLKFDEYVETWQTLITEYYQRIISDDDIYVALQLDEENAMRFSMELGTVLLVMAMRDFKEKKLKSAHKDAVERELVQKVYRSIFADDEETVAACEEFYKNRFAMLGQLAPTKSETTAEKRQKNLLGFARYVVAQCSEKTELGNARVIEKLGVHLTQASGSFIRLIQNTDPDVNGLPTKNKPRFIVTK